MADLVQAAQEETDPNLRQELFAQIQALWAEEIPTLDISQEPRLALSLTKVNGIAADALGLLHYELLTKTDE
jgi:ABC-type transport system substrate-binding protein